MNLWPIVIGVLASFVALALFVLVLYRLVLWARKQSKGAYVFAAAVAPFLAMGNVSDPDFRIVLEAKQLKKREEDDTGDPPNNTDDDDGSEPRRYSGTPADLDVDGAAKKRRLVARSNERRRRPALVWAISIVVGLVALTQLLIQTLPFLPSQSAQLVAALRDAVASVPMLDRATLFLLSAILLTSMTLFFRMRRSSIGWFVAYLALGSAAAVRYALTAARDPWFDAKASLIGVTITALILVYMWRLKRRHALA